MNVWHRRISWPIFYDIFGSYGELYDAVSLSSLKEFQSYAYCGLNLRGSDYRPNFQHPVAAKLHLVRNKLKCMINMQSK